MCGYRSRIPMENIKNKAEGNPSINPSLTEGGLLYSVAAFLLLIIGSYVQNRDFNSGILITEFILILLPSLLLLRVRKYDIPGVLRLNPVSFLNLFIVFFMMLFSLWIVTVVNIFNLWLIKAVFGRVMVSPLPINESPLLVNILLIGASAGICEEVMFRGVIQRGFERFGPFLSILITGFLFGLFHMDFQRLIGTFLLGTLIGFIVYRTNSLFAGMFAHFTNNALAVLISFVAGKLVPADMTQMAANDNALNDYFATLESMPSFQLLGVIVVWVISALFCGAALAGLIWAFVKNTQNCKKNIQNRSTNKVFPGALAFLPGLIAIIVVYVMIAYGLSGLQLDFISNALGNG